MAKVARVAIKTIEFKIDADNAGRRLDHFLAEKLPAETGNPVSRARVRAMIGAGAVYLNGKCIRIASKQLVSGAFLRVMADLDRLGRGAGGEHRIGREHILFEDDYLIAINKPSGLPSQPTMDAARANLFDSAKALLSADIGGGEAYLGMHHRLDRDTSGVIVFTKSRVANAAMAHAFKEHGIQKTYLALSLRPAKKPPDRWHVENNLGVVSRKGGRARYGAVRSGGDRARTDFSLLEASDRALLIEARPLTGRTHQIRVHLAGCGLPILGDDLYGAADGAGVDVPRLMLHAHLLRLDHPVTGVLLEICAPLPEDFSGVKKKIIGG